MYVQPNSQLLQYLLENTEMNSVKIKLSTIHIRTLLSMTPTLCTIKYSEVDIKEMLGFLIDNIFVVFGNKIFQ
jgi:hypothetical protein